MKKKSWWADLEKHDRSVSLSALMLIFGIMLAVQFNSLKEPEVRDTRDIWQLREDLKKEQKKQLELIGEIDKYENMLGTYSREEDHSRTKALNDTLQHLKNRPASPMSPAAASRSRSPGCSPMN